MANDAIPVAFAPAVKIALPDSDWQQQADNQAAGDPWIAHSVDKHAWGFGGRAYLDYVMNKIFYLNLYGEFIYYLKKDYDDTTLLEPFGTAVEIEYGFDLTLEAEPHFEMMFGDGIRLGIEVPAMFTMSPTEKQDGADVPDSESYLFSIGPAISLCLMKFVVPVEFKAGYALPLFGMTADAVNTIIFQVKSYLKF